MKYSEIVEKRRNFSASGYTTLANVNLDVPYVSPLQIISRSPTGPVLVAYHWLDAPSALKNHGVLSHIGYLPGIVFNDVLDMALQQVQLNRSDIYLTQAFHLLPSGRSQTIPQHLVELSFDTITRHETVGRRVIALGSAADHVCKKFGIPHIAVPHPSARIGTYAYKADLLARALRSMAH